jgi:hypothetical protein
VLRRQDRFLSSSVYSFGRPNPPTSLSKMAAYITIGCYYVLLMKNFLIPESLTTTGLLSIFKLHILLAGPTCQRPCQKMAAYITLRCSIALPVINFLIPESDDDRTALYLLVVYSFGRSCCCRNPNISLLSSPNYALGRKFNMTWPATVFSIIK